MSCCWPCGMARQQSSTDGCGSLRCRQYLGVCQGGRIGGGDVPCTQTTLAALLVVVETVGFDASFEVH